MIDNKISILLQRAKYLAVAIVLLLASVSPLFTTRYVSAQPLTGRSMKVTSTNPSDDMLAPDGSTYPTTGPNALPAGDPRNGQKVGHEYSFTVESNADAKAITIQYCDSPFGYMDSCIVPENFSAAAWDSASIDVTVGITTESWTVDSVSANFLTISNGASTLDFEQGDEVTLAFDATATNFFINPSKNYLNNANGVSSPQQATYFAHIRTHNTASPTTTNNASLQVSTIDDGTVASDVTQSIGIYTRVQETLNFSVEGHTDADPPGPTPQNGSTCSPLTRQGRITLGDGNDALSAQQAYYGKSYFRLSTNTANGTVVYYAGETLTSSANEIGAIGLSRQMSNPGNEQFGLAFDLTDNLVSNVGNGGSLIPEIPYNNNANGYAFDGSNPNIPKKLAESNNVVACDTGSIQYVANIAADTPAGIYQTKINYISAPKY